MSKDQGGVWHTVQNAEAFLARKCKDCLNAVLVFIISNIVIEVILTALFVNDKLPAVATWIKNRPFVLSMVDKWKKWIDE